MTAPVHLARKLGEFAARLAFERIPEHVVELAKRAILDGVGVAVAGSHHEGSRLVRSRASECYAPGCSSVVAAEGMPRLSAPGAALCNAMSMHVLDFDDTHYDGIVHPTAVVLPAVLACSEREGVDGRTMIGAYVAGLEAECALGRIATDALYYRGYFNTSVLGVVGAAVAACNVLRLCPDRSAHAVSIAAAQAGGLRATLGTTTKPFLAARAAEQGTMSALLAADGLEGPADIFEEPRGFFATLNDGVADWNEARSLGHAFTIEDPGLAVKIYPVCSAALAAAEAVHEVLEQLDINGDQVARVICEVPRLVAISLTYPRPRTATEAQFSMQFAVGAMLVFGGLGVPHLSADALSDSRLREAFKRVEMRESADAMFEECPEGARVTIETVGGSRRTQFRCAATGDPRNPMSTEDLRAKFRGCAGRGAAARALEVHISSLEEQCHPARALVRLAGAAAHELSDHGST